MIARKVLQPRKRSIHDTHELKAPRENKNSSGNESNNSMWIDNSFMAGVNPRLDTFKKTHREPMSKTKKSEVEKKGIPNSCLPSSVDDEFIQTQHDSFNETDPLFAELDLDNIEKSTTPDNRGEETVQERTRNAKEQIPATENPFVTPTTSRSLKDRFKAAMKSNARAESPQLSKMQDIRRESLEIAMLQASELFHLGNEHDIGPFFGLPTKVQDLLYSSRGIKDLYDWQKECLSLEAVRSGRNLIYSLPTSGGKTLVAEILIFQQLLCKKKDAILILPFVSIVQEKVRGLSAFALELDFVVEEYAASKGQFPPRKRRKRKSLYVCTIEKANSLMNSLIEIGRITDIGLVVVDELHMLGEGGSRGACLEMSLAKIMYTCADAQIIGMSATLNNISDLQQFLSAEVYSNDFRPVELVENVKIEDTIYMVDQTCLCPDDRLQHSRVTTFQYSTEQKKRDPDQIAGLVLEVVPERSCLVFCPTKKNCENVAELLCRFMSIDMVDVKKTERRAMLKALYHDGGGQICPVLKKTIHYGVAYHHSGLTMDERKLIEEAYLEGTLCVLCCTSTLAAGVNLPAKRVVLRSPYVGEGFISRSQYKQMTGRAGRAGIDSSGESILVLQKRDKSKLLDLIGGPFEYCLSSLLYEDGKGLHSLLLTTVGLGMTPTSESVINFLQKTLFYVQSAQLGQDIIELTKSALQQLLEYGLIAQRISNELEELPTLEVTDLGRATFKGSIEITRGKQLYGDLQQATESLVVCNHLHLLYLVTPYDLVSNVKPQWMIYLNEISSMDAAELTVANRIGISEGFIAKKASAQRTRKDVDEFTVSRFYLTLVLYNLWKQKSIWEVAAKFHLPRGFIQQLLNGAASFAACVSHFCEVLEEFWAYQDLFSNFVKRLSYCVSIELIPLLEIPGVKIGRARQLFNAGYKNLTEVAFANPDDLVRNIEHMPRKSAKQIVASAMVLLNEKVESLREEADDMVAMPNHKESRKMDHISSSSVLPSDSQFSEDAKLSAVSQEEYSHIY